MWVNINRCPYCGSQVSDYRAAYSHPVFNAEFCGGTVPVQTLARFVRCDSCGLIIQSPRMSDERIGLYYSSGLYREASGRNLMQLDAGEERRAERVKAWVCAVPSFTPDLKSHLDIGCSRGSFLKAMRAHTQHGFDANSGYARDVQAFDSREKLKRYELVSSIHVLEHVTDPQAELKWYKSLSTRWVLIEVPGVSSALLFPHLFYFPVPVLMGMIEKAGLKIVAMTDVPPITVLCNA
jgi:hypothetical protein